MLLIIMEVIPMKTRTRMKTRMKTKTRMRIKITTRIFLVVDEDVDAEVPRKQNVLKNIWAESPNVVVIEENLDLDVKYTIIFFTYNTNVYIKYNINISRFRNTERQKIIMTQILYTNNTEYRKCLRTFFNMINFEENNEIIKECIDLDDETYDELLYDSNAAINGMNIIYEKTQNNSLFKELYMIAAGRMFSEDLQIGIAILLSYDHFTQFHRCLRDFYSSPDTFTENTESYKVLKKQI